MEERLPKGTLGGQAVIEGVMMKGPDSYSVAVRKPDKKIEVKLHKYESFGDRHKFAKLPFIRGVVSLVESLVVGMKTLSYSSSFYRFCLNGFAGHDARRVRKATLRLCTAPQSGLPPGISFK